jgi:hypothetical protein
MNNEYEKKIMTIDKAQAILSETLEEVAQRKTTVRRATAVAHLALAFARITEVANLKARIELLEQALKKRK